VGRLVPGRRVPPRAASLYRIDADLQAEEVLDGITVSNGLDWSPDNARMYYIDSPTRRVDVLDYDIETGAASNRRPLYSLPDDLPGLPEGCAWTRRATSGSPSGAGRACSG